MTNKILVIKHGSFGDIVQINGCLRDIRENYKDNEIYILTAPAFRSYFERCPYVDRVIVDERKSRWNIFYLLKIKDIIKNLKFQKVFDLQNSSRTEFYRKYLSNSVEWISSRTILYSTETKEEFDRKSILERFQIQLSRAQINIQFTTKPQVSWMIDNEYNIPSNIKKNYVVIFPFSSKENRFYRVWPYFKELLEFMKKKYSNIDYIIVPGPDELKESKNFDINILTNKNKATDFYQLAKILVGAKFVIANNTGPAHLAAHLGCKGLVILGADYSAKQLGIETNNFSSISCKNLTNLTVQTVIEKIDSHL